MIPRELVKKLRKIEIKTARLANEQLAGSYHSVFKGRGMTFNEVREYMPGDDVRFIDWNVSARMNEAFVKVFTEEREMTVMLAVDLSASNLFGSDRAKIDLIAEIAALLAFSADKNGDRIGLILFTDRVERFVPPKKGRAHVMRVVTEILNAKPEGKATDINVALDALGGLRKRRSVAFLLSDFLDDGYEKPLKIAAKRHDLIPIQVEDPLELDLPNLGLTWVEDLESGELIEVDFGHPAVRKAFYDATRAKDVMRDQLFRKLRLDAIRVKSNEDYLGPITHFFRTRERRMAGFR